MPGNNAAGTRLASLPLTRPGARQDNGRGIDKDALPGLFELFTRARDPARSGDTLGAGLGLGLGLPLVKELASLHGGSIQVRSEGIDKGAEFTLRLPLQGGGTAADQGISPG